MAEGQTDNVDRERIVDDYKHAIIQSVEHDEMRHGDSPALREQYDERTWLLDENESACKEQYDNSHCEEVTGLSSYCYRHRVIEDYTHEKMAETSGTKGQPCDYWNESGKRRSTESANTIESVRDEQSDYWAENSSANSATNKSVNEQENEKANEASC